MSAHHINLLHSLHLSLSMNRYASALYALYPCRGHHALRCRPAHPIRSAITRAVMVDPRVGTHRARSPIQAHAPVWRQAAHVPARSPTHARLADKAQSHRHVMDRRCPWTARVSTRGAGVGAIKFYTDLSFSPPQTITRRRAYHSANHLPQAPSAAPAPAPHHVRHVCP